MVMYCVFYSTSMWRQILGVVFGLTYLTSTLHAFRTTKIMEHRGVGIMHTYRREPFHFQDVRLRGLSDGTTESLSADNPDMRFYVNFPDIKVPELKVPDVKVPDVQIPDVSSIAMPDFPSMPSIQNFNVPSFGVPSVDGMDANVLLPGLGLVAIVVLTASATSGVSGNTKPASKRKKKNVLEIPYHAAARLAYDAWLEAHPDESYNEAAYQSFQLLFETQAATEAKAKKLARDMDMFGNEPLPEPIVRTVTKQSSKESKPGKTKFFFAS